MKKLFFTFSLFSFAIAFSQVGISTNSPQATLDVTAKNPTGTSTKADGIILPRVDRQRAQSMTGVATSTLIYVNNIATGTLTGTAVNIDAVGYYYFDGTSGVWVKLSEAGGVVSLSSLALKNTTFQPNTTVYASEYPANTFNTIVWNTAPKLDNTKLSYNNTTGVFTVLKAGYYQVLASTHMDMALNPVGTTNGTAASYILKSGVSIGEADSTHGERTDNVHHTVAGAAYFNAGDTIYVQMVMTRGFRIVGGDSFVSIMYLGQ